MCISAVGEDGRGEAEVWRVECEDTLDVGKHEPAAFLVSAPVRERHGLVIEDGQKCVGGHDAAHGVCDEDGADRGVDDGGGSAGRNFEVNYAGLEPTRGLLAAEMRGGEGKVGRPFAEVGDTASEVTTCFIAGVDDGFDGEVREGNFDESFEILKRRRVNASSHRVGVSPGEEGGLTCGNPSNVSSSPYNPAQSISLVCLIER